jgi:serine protease Do
VQLHDLEGFAETARRLRHSTVEIRGRSRGSGSGVIWRRDGLIVTNAHVVREREATVALWDGRTFHASVQSRDPERDLAALRIRASSLPAAPSRDSRELRAGELVLAMGCPLGVPGVLTAGAIYSVSRDWIQADVRLAPGNSGGPLADAGGRVVGINTMIAGGIALAAPSRAVERFLNGWQRARLGVTVRPVKVPAAGCQTSGLLVLEIEPGSPAQQAGLIAGDVIALRSPRDLEDALDDGAPGTVLPIDLIRGGRWISTEVVLRTMGRSAEAA